MANCVTCDAICERAGQHHVKTDCISYVPKVYPKPRTNIDRIRAMDIDHLIEWYCLGRPCGTCPYGGVECGLRDWLNAEAEGEDNDRK